MSRPPLLLDWTSFLSSIDDAPPPELEVVSTAAAGVSPANEESALSEFTSDQLHEDIRHMEKHLSSWVARNLLPDKGAKLRQKLSLYQAELDRRILAEAEKETGESTSPEASVSCVVPSPGYTKFKHQQKSTFTSIFSTRLNHKADATAKEDQKFISQGKCGSLSKHEGFHPYRWSLQPARMSQRQKLVQCAIIDTDKFYNSDWRTTNSSKIFSSHGRKNFSGLSPKRKVSESRDSLHPGPKKVPHVVLLDEEEVQSTEPIHTHAHDEWKEAKIYYPSRDDPEFIELSYSDIKCLDPGQYLSSPIMNFYIRYLQRSISPTGKTISGCYFFNTYFYKKLDETMFCKGDQSVDFLKLRRWWKGVNIFQKAYIFLPIHDNLHWSLVIICIPTKEDESGPLFLHLDSLGLHESVRIFDIVERCFRQEWHCITQNDPHPDVPISNQIWKDLPRWIKKEKIMVPQQENEYDCGLFVLYFMERFIEEAPIRLNSKDISSMFGKNWFNPEDASGLRVRIRDLLVEEFEKPRFENGQIESPASSSVSLQDYSDQYMNLRYAHPTSFQLKHSSALSGLKEEGLNNFEFRNGAFSFL